jgi:hypothetical protein
MAAAFWRYSWSLRHSLSANCHDFRSLVITICEGHHQFSWHKKQEQSRISPSDTVVVLTVVVAGEGGLDTPSRSPGIYPWSRWHLTNAVPPRHVRVYGGFVTNWLNCARGGDVLDAVGLRVMR